MKQNTVRNDKSGQHKADHIGPVGRRKGFQFYSKWIETTSESLKQVRFDFFLLKKKLLWVLHGDWLAKGRDKRKF